MVDIPPQQFEPQQPAKKPFKGLFLLEIGAFEVGFVLIVLITIFGTLNFFNILPLSRRFSQLSFLPHATHVLQPTPTPIDNKPEAFLRSFLTNTLQSSLLPLPHHSSFAIQELAPNLFESKWQSQSGDVTTRLFWNLSDPQNLSIVLNVNLANFPNQIGTPEAQIVENKYLKIESNNTWQCKSNQNIFVCGQAIPKDTINPSSIESISIMKAPNTPLTISLQQYVPQL